jgi:secondary thiamine-phosphate synthase enzyme
MMGSALKPRTDELDMTWLQRELELPPHRRGFHLVTDAIVRALPEIGRFRAGLLHVFIQHTSASLTINENADPDVAADLERSFNHLVGEDLPFQHTVEGPDDMPAHIKAAMLGSSVSIPIRDGRLCLGTWQGIFLCEHRNRAGSRRLLLTLFGESEQEAAPPGGQEHRRA